MTNIKLPSGTMKKRRVKLARLIRQATGVNFIQSLQISKAYYAGTLVGFNPSTDMAGSYGYTTTSSVYVINGFTINFIGGI